MTPDTSGERIRIEGQVFDGDGAVVPDCMLEIWQADAQGRFSDPQDKRALPNSTFKGFGRIGTDAKGGYAFDTIKPGQVADPDGKPQAPHIVLAVFARGMLLHNYSRIYFDGEAANASDPVLALVPADRRATLIATRQPGGNAVYRFDIHCRATKRRCSSTCRRGRQGLRNDYRASAGCHGCGDFRDGADVRSAVARDHGVAGPAPARLRP